MTLQTTPEPQTPDPIMAAIEEEDRIKYSRSGWNPKLCIFAAAIVAALAIFGHRFVPFTILLTLILAAAAVHNVLVVLASAVCGLRKIEELGIGIGPKMFWWRSPGPLYGFHLLPLGGFVRFPGGDRADNFESHPVWRQVFIILAPPILFTIAGWLICESYGVHNAPGIALRWLASPAAYSPAQWHNTAVAMLEALGDFSNLPLAFGILLLYFGIGGLFPIPPATASTAVYAILKRTVSASGYATLHRIGLIIGIPLTLGLLVVVWGSILRAVLFK